MAELGSSLASPFRDPAWPARTLVGAALEILPVLFVAPLIVRLLHGGYRLRSREAALLGIAALVALLCRWIEIGYLRRLALAVLAGADNVLPRWDRFRSDLAEGFKLSLVTLGLFLPAVGTATALALTAAALGAARLAWVPVVVVMPVLALLTLLYLPAALLTAIATGDLGAAFAAGNVLRFIERWPSRYALAFVITLMALLLAQLGFVLLCIGVFATRFLANCIGVHAFASAYRDARGPVEPGRSAP